MSEAGAVEKHYRNCPICEAMCGLELTIDRGADRVLSIRGDSEDPASRGYICAKSQAMAGLRDDPDRIRRPLRRRGRDFEEIGWDEAIGESCEQLRATRDRHGPDSLGYYFGNPVGHRPGMGLYLPAILGALNTRQTYWVGPIDQSPKLMATLLMYGSADPKSVPDLDRTDHLVIIGANPVVSNGSLVIAPGFRHRIEAIRARGGKVVVIDPRRTETAAIADDYVAVRPGSDALLLMAMIETLFREDRVRIGRLADRVKHLDLLRALASEFPAERVADACGVPAETIAKLARDFAAAPSATIYGRLGTCVQQFGSICNWLMDTLHVLTGNLDRPGGAMFGLGVPLRRARGEKGAPPPIGRWRSRVSGLPEFMGMLPAAVMADEILEPGPGQVKAFITQAGNPVLSHPNGERIATALQSLDFMLSIDIYLNETTRYADIILPSRDYLEESDFPALTSPSMVRKYAKWSPPIFPTDPDALPDGDILTRLAAGLRGVTPDQVEGEMVDLMLRTAKEHGRPECRGMDIEQMRAAVGDTPGVDRLFDIMLRAGSHGDAFGAVPDGISIAKLREHPHGLDFGPLDELLPDMIAAADGMIDLAPALLVEDVGRLRQELDKTRDPSMLLLIGRRDSRSKNSWLHNVPALAKGKDRCTALINPADALCLGLKDGDDVEISNATGSLVAPVAITAEMMEGVVSLPHGWGHGRPDTNQRVAAAKPGVNANAIVDEGLLDVPSGSSALNGVPVRLSPVTSSTSSV